VDANAAPDAGTAAPALTGWRAAVRDLLQMLRFHSRLPVPVLGFEGEGHAPPDFRVAPRMLPIAGAMIALPSALALWLAAAAGLPPLVAAAISLAILALATGAMHEDGLADAFDGLAGAGTRERRLEIMKDSRIGAFGAVSLVLALMVRAAALAGLLPILGAAGSALAVVAAAALSRPVSLMPLALLPAARREGASAAVGRPGGATFAVAAALGFGLAAGLCMLAGAGAAAALAGFAAALVLAALLTWWANRAIGGQTGDIAGACQQLAEIGFYVGLLAVAGWGKA
jgi:adenosylcobinamide-GDP ribazoletransferase